MSILYYKVTIVWPDPLGEFLLALHIHENKIIFYSSLDTKHSLAIIEFTTKIKDGVIKIPKDHLQDLKALQDNLRVIILVESVPERKQKRKITSLNIDTRDINFDQMGLLSSE